jgi:hypothetical protein
MKRKGMLNFLLIIVGGYLVLLFLMFVFQNRLIFIPTQDLLITPDQLGIEAEEIHVGTQDGEKLHGWFFPNGNSEYLVILCHGNAGNISTRIDIARMFERLGISIILFDYRGYGLSTGSPNEQGLYHDVEAVVEFAGSEYDYDPSNIVLYGRSLGGAVASYAATKYDVAGLIVDSSFESLEQMVSELYPFVPAVLARHDFPTLEYLQSLEETPVMIMHSPDDQIIGFSHGQTLFEAANEPKKFVELTGGHNDSFNASIGTVAENWTQFLQIIEGVRNPKRTADPE